MKTHLKRKRYHVLYSAALEIAERLTTDTGSRLIRWIEVGTYDGRNAADLAAFIAREKEGVVFDYYGFDLWEDMTDEIWEKEISKSRKPPSREDVKKRLNRKVHSLSLFKGNTRDTLNAAAIPKADLIFIDGGHSAETVFSDFAAASKLLEEDGIIVMDDWYSNRDDIGARVVTDKLAVMDEWNVEVGEERDKGKGGLLIHQAKVTSARNSS